MEEKKNFDNLDVSPALRNGERHTLEGSRVGDKHLDNERLNACSSQYVYDLENQIGEQHEALVSVAPQSYQVNLPTWNFMLQKRRIVVEMRS